MEREGFILVNIGNLFHFTPFSWPQEHILSVADPGFSREGVPTPKMGVLTYYFAIFFEENCMKMKEFGPPDTPLRSTTDVIFI